VTQRALIADKVATLRHGGDRSKGPTGLLLPEAAEMLGVSPRSVKRVRRVRLHGAPEVNERGERYVWRGRRRMIESTS
jgi:hypothetical protein